MAQAPRVKVLKRINVPMATVIKDRSVKSLYDTHGAASSNLANAIKSSEEATSNLKAALGPKLRSRGIDQDTDWRIKRVDDGLVVEIIERETRARGPRIETETADF